MIRFVSRLLLFLSPILVLLCIYLVNDPFKVLYHYDSYFKTNVHDYVTLDKDYVSTQTFINNYPTHPYDSYIFGNSNSMYFGVAEWQKHITATACYHFDASGETIYGMEKKLQFLKKRGINIRNALFCTSYNLLAVTTNQRGTILTKHPALSGQKELDFQAEFLRDFFDVDFLYAYLDLLLTHHIKPYMIEKELMSNSLFRYDVETNEVSFPDYEELIATNRDSFYGPRMHVFYKRDTVQHYSAPIIGAEQIKLLQNMKKILKENRTNYRFIINPLYNQVKIDTTDLKILKDIFGADRVFDFSGINDMTQSIYNYYEATHYRPLVANRIMNSIYAHQPTKQ